MFDKDSQLTSKIQQAKFWLALKFIPRLSISKKLALVERFGIEMLFEQTPERSVLKISEKQYHAIIQPDNDRISLVIEQTQLCGAEVIGFDDKHYPQLLKQIFDPPLVLFVKGDKSQLNCEKIAIVGSRNATIDGRETAAKFAEQLSISDIVVTSGLALGIDAAAHQAAVKIKKPTIAVIATGIEQVYPKRHKLLAKSILEQGGVIVSEFLPHTPPKAGHFPKRNRIISGMSKGVVVVEATERSGSLITARMALEQNRDVFAVPSSINNPQAKGCHQLIKQGAKLVENIADIIEEINFVDDFELNLNKINHKEETKKKNSIEVLSNDPLLASVGYEITPVDKVVSRSKLPTDVVLTRLTMLELRGLVSAVPGGYIRID